MMKSLAINRCTGIDSRSAIGDVNHPIVNQSEPPTIRELNDLFMEEGVKLSVSACRQALSDWGGSAAQITHMVSTTCTASSNPGFDAIVAKKLGLARDVEKVATHVKRVTARYTDMDTHRYFSTELDAREAWPP